MPSIKEHCPAKINLNLHVTGRRNDGYHNLSSLVCFAKDAGDVIEIYSADEFKFHVRGEFANNIPPLKNSVIQAAQWLADRMGKRLDCAITLHKSLPVAAGIGGGSADAAGVIRALITFWDLNYTMVINDIIHDSFILGADVPVCLKSRVTQVTGAGDVLHDTPALSELYAVLVNPMKPCATADVFRNFENHYSYPIERDGNIIKYLELTGNELTAAATSLVPDINQRLHALTDQGAIVSRMSGSGATCFGIYSQKSSMAKAHTAIAAAHPEWWSAASQLI